MKNKNNDVTTVLEPNGAGGFNSVPADEADTTESNTEIAAAPETAAPAAFDESRLCLATCEDDPDDEYTYSVVIPLNGISYYVRYMSQAQIEEFERSDIRMADSFGLDHALLADKPALTAALGEIENGHVRWAAASRGIFSEVIDRHVKFWRYTPESKAAVKHPFSPEIRAKLEAGYKRRLVNMIIGASQLGLGEADFLAG